VQRYANSRINERVNYELLAESYLSFFKNANYILLVLMEAASPDLEKQGFLP
jgi:hypothetical protein